jgi:hypothetical protein
VKLTIKLNRRVRASLTFFGYDVSHLSDEELLDQMSRVAYRMVEAANAAGVTLEQMSDAMLKLVVAVGEVARVGEADLESRGGGDG